MTIQEALIEGRNFLKSLKVEAWSSAGEILLAHSLGKDRSFLFSHSSDEMDLGEYNQFKALLGKRGKGIPVAHLLGYKEFLSMKFKVNEHVLIPRPETELLVEKIIEILQSDLQRKTVVDVGTGSGIIAVALKKKLPHIHMFAGDVSDEALYIAEENAKHHGVEISFKKSDLLHAFNESSFDVIVSNLPYIPVGELDSLEREVKNHEPHLALFGGEDGLELVRKLIKESFEYLKPGGILAMELAWNQMGEVKFLLEKHHFELYSVIQDHQGHERHVLAKKQSLDKLPIRS